MHLINSKEEQEMSDNKKYYYLKLKENFFDSEEMILLQNMVDGYLYSDILMKLYLRSLKNEGKLIFKDLIPYTPSALAQVVRHQVGTVEKALRIFQELGLVEILDNGAIYMLDIQNFIGESSTEADRIRKYRTELNNINIYGQDDLDQQEIKKDEKALWEQQFEQFYKAYPKKVKKQNVEKWFKKNKPSNELFSSMMNSLEQFKGSKDWLKEKGQYIPYPSTWLNQKRWEDENNVDAKPQIEYKETAMTEEEYLRKLNEGGKRYE